MEDCYCKNCGMAYAWVNDKDSGNCWSCQQVLVAVKCYPIKQELKQRNEKALKE